MLIVPVCANNAIEYSADDPFRQIKTGSLISEAKIILRTANKGAQF